MSHLSLSLLGPPHIERNGVPVELTPRKATALLVYLATDHKPHPRDALATLLWPELDQTRAHAALRSTLWALKKAIGEEWLDVDRQTIGLNRDADLWVDVDHFHSRLAACRTHGHPAGETCPVCLAPLADAIALYRGTFLTGFTLRDSTEFDDWQRIQAEDLCREFAGALESLVRCHSAQGAFEPAITYARRWVALDPLHEPAHRHLMQLHAWAGQRTAAVHQYQECVRVLKEELGLLPQEETVQLFQVIQEHQAPPPLLSPPPMYPHNLPHQTTPFIGREEELAEIGQLLEGASCRLLTLVGPGGIGKTRLALEAAAGRIGAFPHGVYLVPLVAVRSADLLVSSIADALNLAFYGKEDLKVQLLNYLRKKAMLLVLDNFEHLLEGVGLLVEILQAAPEVKILVTSRERLNLQGEWVLEVKGLRFPEDEGRDKMEGYSAVQLFVQGAHRVYPSFRLSEGEKPAVARICRLVEGMPLAIELAATWVRALSCAEIAVEIEQNLGFLTTPLRDVPERHRSLQAVFDRSWDLLSEEEQAAFRRLSVFRGGFRRKAAEEVAGVTPHLLSGLVDKSFVRRAGGGRYGMLEVVRQYAEAKLGQFPEAKRMTRDLHCAYYAVFLQQEEADLQAKHEKALEKIGQEIENVKMGWDWAVERGKEEEIGKALNSFFTFHEIQSWYREGKEVAGRTAEALREVEGTAGLTNKRRDVILGRVLARQGAFCYRLGLYEEAQALLRESLGILRRLDARPEMPFTLNHLGFVTHLLGQYAEANQLCQESLAICKRAGDRVQMADALNTLGYIAYALGENAEAKRLYQEYLTICRENGDRWGVAFSLNNLGYLANLSGEHAEAKQLCQEALTILEKIGHHYAVAATLDSLGNISHELGEYRESKRYFQEALKTTNDIQAVPLGLEVLIGIATLLMKERELQRAAELLALISHHPASDKQTQDRAEQLLSELESQIPPQMIAEAREKGKTSEFGEIVETTLTLLESDLSRPV